VHRPETLWVNSNDRRFTNESLSILAGRVLTQQASRFLWALFDSALKDYMVQNPSARQIGMDGEDWLRTLGEELNKEARWTRRTVAIGESWQEVASKLDLPSEDLVATVERYNALCDVGRDVDFAKPSSFLRPLRTPPHYAVLGVRFRHGTERGAKVNERREVAGRSRQRLQGPYATGDSTSGWVTHIGVPGTSLGFAFTSGHIAGEQVAAYLRR
jgi:fumarate reductase flavoprotein subunit